MCYGIVIILLICCCGAPDTACDDLVALGIGSTPGVMEFHAQGDMVAAGVEIVSDMIRRVGADASTLMPSGSKARRGRCS